MKTIFAAPPVLATNYSGYGAWRPEYTEGMTTVSVADYDMGALDAPLFFPCGACEWFNALMASQIIVLRAGALR